MIGKETELMRVLTRDGVVDVPIELGSGDASTIGSYWNAIQHFLATGEEDRLEPFRDRIVGALRVEGDPVWIVGGYRLETDPDWIEYWAYQGDLGFPDIYSLR